jgi:hypothetical protein
LRERLGATGRQRASTEFRLEDQIRTFSDWYRHLLSATGEQAELRALRIRLRRQRLQLAELEHERDRLARDIERREGAAAAEALVDEFVPDGDPILVVSRGDQALLEVLDAAAHFPQAANGVWLGHHPASSVEAILQLEELRGGGARFLLFPRSALWWLEHYRGLRDHLDRNYVTLAVDEARGAIFDLRGGPSPVTEGPAQREVA